MFDLRRTRTCMIHQRGKSMAKIPNWNQVLINGDSYSVLVEALQTKNRRTITAKEQQDIFYIRCHSRLMKAAKLCACVCMCVHVCACVCMCVHACVCMDYSTRVDERRKCWRPRLAYKTKVWRRIWGSNGRELLLEEHDRWEYSRRGIWIVIVCINSTRRK